MTQSNLKLKERLRNIIPKWRDETKSLAKSLGNVIIDEVKVEQVLGGMRDIKCMPCETSYLDPQEGIRFRNLSIPEAREKLPKPSNDAEPYALGIWHLLLTGEVPTESEVKELEAEALKRSDVPGYVFDILKSAPTSMHPMTQLSMGVLAMQKESEFVKQYNAGAKKDTYWEPTFEDSLTLLARMPVISAFIYRRTYKNDASIPKADPKLDWGANFAHMMGVQNKEYQNLMRLYLLLHSDHESGNVSAHTGWLVASALSDTYYSISAALNGLAGPLHGLANQECLKWVMDMMQAHGGKTPTKEQAEKYAVDTLAAGRVIPGYGHAVLRKTDPRFTAQREYFQKYCPDDPVCKAVNTVFEVVPDVLLKAGKAKNPWPNVDAHSGCLQYYYGVKEVDFYTVLFGVSRAMGITAQGIWARAVGAPIERPKSLTLAMIKDDAEKRSSK